MHTVAHSSLVNLSPTGFAYSENNMVGQGRGLIENNSKTHAMMAVFLGLFIINTGATQYYQHLWPEKSETILTKAQLQQGITQDQLSLMNTVQMPSFDEQLTRTKQFLGLNILELATILQVSRPTIYGWIESKEIKVRKKNQDRLNSLYEISKAWENKHLGRLGSYLHKPLGITNISLFTLLKSRRLNLAEIHRHLDNIAELIIIKRQKDEVHEALLKKHGFTPMNKEDVENSIDDIDLLD